MREPKDVIARIAEAEKSRSPEKARALFVAATTGMRRAEICALRRVRDIDWDRGRILVQASIIPLPGQPLFEKGTKNRAGLFGPRIGPTVSCASVPDGCQARSLRSTDACR